MGRFALLSLILVGCGTSVVPGGDGGGTDSGPDAASVDAGACPPVPCTIDCEYGFARGPDGCERCACNPPPDESCVDDSGCVIARETTGCCSCERGYSRDRVNAEPCLVERGHAPPPGCLPDPERCATVDCAACEPVVRAVCEADSCLQSSECVTGDVPFRFTCVAPCAAHSDCTIAANYAQCCGGCFAAPRGYVDADACVAERQSESSCAPAPGACEGLGCASPPFECVGSGPTAVCMADGSCGEGGPGGSCPTGSHDEGSVCVPD